MILNILLKIIKNMVFKNIVADEDPEEMYADLKQIKAQSANQNAGRRKSAFALQL